MTSLELARAYEQNEAAADATYKGRTLNVTGTVTDIVKDVFDDTVVRLEGGNMLFGVSAELKPSEEQRAIALRKGQELTVQCMGRGEVVSMPMLDECTIETPPGQAERSGSAQGAAQRTSSEQSAASIETRLVGLNGQDRGKVCAVFGQNLPNFYDEVEELGMSRAMAKWETERDEVLASGNPENIAAMAEFDLFLPGILKHVAEAHSMPGQSGIDPRKHATDAYVAECVRLGPENVK